MGKFLLLIILLSIWTLTHTIFHEWGHVFLLRKYTKNDILVVYNWFNKKPVFVRLNGYCIALGSIKGRAGKTWVENDFADCAHEEIKKIALAGYIVQVSYGFIKPLQEYSFL